MKPIQLSIFALCFAMSASGEELYDKILLDDFPAAINQINFEDVRQNKHLDISDVVRRGDLFLYDHFGEKFKPIVLGVSYTTVDVKGGKIWCWVIKYHHPQDDRKSNPLRTTNLRIFLVYLSSDGVPLMKVIPANQDKNTQ